MHFCHEELRAIMQAFPFLLIAYFVVKNWVSSAYVRLRQKNKK